MRTHCRHSTSPHPLWRRPYRLALIALALGLGCTRPNPAYFPDGPDSGGKDIRGNDAPADTGADTTTVDTGMDRPIDRGPDTGPGDAKIDTGKPDLRTDAGDGSVDAGRMNCIDLDGDGYGVGTGCAGPDCDDGDPNTLSSVVSRPCPAGSMAHGTCRPGTQSCTAGVWSACTGQVVASGEACNGEDDDCDGMADDNLPATSFTCGQGACQVTVASCSMGVLGPCVPNLNMAMADDKSCDGTDSDCDGIVDQNCQTVIDSCIHVSPNGDDTADGSTGAPLLTIPTAIAKAFNPGGMSKAVCVAGGPTCQDNTTYTVGDTSPFVMLNGVSVYGNYESTAWNRCPLDANAPAPTVTIQLKERTGVNFSNAINLPTTLDGFVLARNISGPAPTSIAAVTVNGARQVRLANLVVTDAPVANQTFGVNLVGGAEATITHCLLFGGAGTAESDGVNAITSKVTIHENCSNVDTMGHCAADCSTTPTLGIVGQGSSTTSGTATAVVLSGSPGSSVETSTLCSAQGKQAIGVYIVGDATGTVIHNSSISASGGGTSSLGILATECNNSAPWIVGNTRIQGQQGTTRAAGIVALGACNPVIDGNALISGGGDSTTPESAGVACESNGTSQASLCAILGNESIQGSGTTRTTQAIGVACRDKSCVRVAGNVVKGNLASTNAIGVYLHNDGTMVEQNLITGGCGVQSAMGLLADDSFAGVQNNLITAGACTGLGAVTPSPANIGVRVFGANDLNEMDIDSNTIDGGGNTGICTSTAVELGIGTNAAPAAPKGIVRNNILTGGACSLAVTTGGLIRTDFSETRTTTDPRVFQNNDLDSSGTPKAVLYFDEGTTQRTSIDAVNGLADITTNGGNISQPPMFMTPSSDLSTANLHLNTGSACIGAGAPGGGAPLTDLDGKSRSPAPSIGAYQ